MPALSAVAPGRHPDGPRPVPAGVRLSALALGVRKPTSVQWDRLGAALTVGDPAMDRVVDWMVTTGTTQARPLFDRAVREGIGAVTDAPAALRELFASIEATPDWVDWEQIERGQHAMQAGGVDGIYLARDVSLLGGYLFSGFNKTLLRTGALEKKSNQRFAETFQWALDITAEDGLRPGGAGYEATLRVRLVHAFVRRHVAAMPDWDARAWGLPVNQTDMAATLLGALIAPAAGAIGVGQIYSPADLNAVAHVTRYVGWLIGVEEEWLPRTFRDGVRGLYHLISALSAPDETTKVLAVPMAADPLTWSYPTLQGPRRRLARAQHLSLTSAYLGPRAMHTLGLRYALPWYPLLRFPVNLVRSLAALLLPGGRDRAAVRGGRQQRALMHTISSTSATVGAAATHLVHTG